VEKAVPLNRRGEDDAKLEETATEGGYKVALPAKNASSNLSSESTGDPDTNSHVPTRTPAITVQDTAPKLDPVFGAKGVGYYPFLFFYTVLPVFTMGMAAMSLRLLPRKAELFPSGGLF
jgi:hypothetical protein